MGVVLDVERLRSDFADRYRRARLIRKPDGISFRPATGAAMIAGQTWSAERSARFTFA